MGIFDWVKNVFRKKPAEPKKSLPPLKPLPAIRDAPRDPLPPPPEPPGLTPEPLPPPPKMPEPIMREPIGGAERVDVTNIRTKIDLLLSEMDHLKTQNQIITEQLKKIERKLSESKGIRYY